MLIENNASSDVRKRRTIKIIVPILILCAVFGIWLIKGSEKDLENVSLNPDFDLNVTEKIDLDELKAYGLPIIIDFGADSCLPCKEMAPVLKELNEELQGKAIIKFVDVWKNPDFAEDYPIRAIPTQVFFDAKGDPYTPQNPEAFKMNMYTMRDSEEHVLTTHEGGLTKDDLLAILKEMGME
jgi:thioredoxin 1